MKNKAFTLVEILMVVGLITALAVSLIFVINPMEMVRRGLDTTRKKDLDDAKKMLEQYIGDTGCYPQPTQVCIEGTNTAPCHICTKVQPTQFAHFTKDICDPKHGTSSDYLYDPETTLVKGIGNVVVPCPKWFRIFSILDSKYNSSEDVWGCKRGGCGVNPVYGYSYLITSPGGPVDVSVATNWYCYSDRLDKCIQCAPYENCSLPSNDCYNQDLYPMRQNCCSDYGITPCN